MFPQCPAILCSYYNAMLVLFLKYDKAKNDLEPKVLLLKCGESQISLTIFFTSRQCYSFTYD